MVGADGVIRGRPGTGGWPRRPGRHRGRGRGRARRRRGRRGRHDGRTYDMTGPEAFTMAEAAEELSRVSGRTISYHAETLEEAYASRAHYGAPDWEVAGWVTTYAAVASGDLRRSAATWPPSPGTRRSAWPSSCAATPTAIGSSSSPGCGPCGPGPSRARRRAWPGLALVVGALAPGQAQLDLDQLALEVDPQRDQRQAALVDPGRQLVDLLAVEQACAGRSARGPRSRCGSRPGSACAGRCRRRRRRRRRPGATPCPRAGS